MDKTLEKVLIGLAFVALAALVIANIRQPSSQVAAVENLPAEDYTLNQTSGPLYLLGNMPWAYQPWVGNAMPQLTAGQEGQSGDFTQSALAPGSCLSGGC